MRRDEPPSGEEVQVDYGRLGKWTDPQTGETMILNAFILVLSFSRHMFVAVVRRMDAAAWLARVGASVPARAVHPRTANH